MSESDNCIGRAPLDARWMFRQVYDVSMATHVSNDLPRKVQIT
jgi:hypothetical protein